MKIADLPAIGPAQAERLSAASVATTEELLDRAATRRDRQRLSVATGIPPERLLGWANHAELSALDGVGHDYATLLEAAGVNCLVELVRRDPEHLADSIADLIAARAAPRHVPAAGEVVAWIAQATRQGSRLEQ